MQYQQHKSIPHFINASLARLKKLKRGYPGAAQEIAFFLTRNGMSTDAQACKKYHGTWKAAAESLYHEATQWFGGVQIFNPKHPFNAKPGAARRYDLAWYLRLAPLVEKTKARMQKQGLRPSNEAAIRRILARPRLRKFQVYEDQWIKQFAHHNAAFLRAKTYLPLLASSQPLVQPQP